MATFWERASYSVDHMFSLYFDYFGCKGRIWVLIAPVPGPEVIKLFSCSTQLSLKFILLINVKMPTVVGILTFISRIIGWL